MNNLYRISILITIVGFQLTFAFSFSGVVKDNKSGQPLENVFVWMYDYPDLTRTDSEGKFNLGDITPIILNTGASPSNEYLIWDGINNRIRLNSSLYPVSIALYTLQGRCIYQYNKTVHRKKSFSLPQLSNGFYIIRISFPQHVFTRKILHLGTRNVIRMPALTLNGSPARAIADSLFTLVFMRDDYIAKRVSVKSSFSNILIPMSYDSSGYIFDQDKLHTYEVTLSDANWKWLDENWELEGYTSCTFKHNNVDYGEIGIRYKGSSSLAGCFDENGNKINPKISMKVKFDKYNDDTRFYKVKRLNFHYMDRDPTYMHERLGYSLYREMGIYAPRAVHGKLYINGNYHGIFTIVEQIDGRFTDNRLSEDGDGNLYKEAWSCQEQKDWYPNNLKTNTDTIDVSKMIAFADAVLQLNSTNFKSEISKWTDLHYFMRYIAVDRAIVNWDGIMAWYSNKDWAGNHNYYWYEQQNENGKFWLIPWDLDNVLEKNDPIFEVTGVPRWYEGKNDTTFYPTPFGNGLFIRPPARDHLINMLAENGWEWYLHYGDLFLEGPFALSSLEEKVNKWIEQIDQAVKDEPYGQGYEKWKNQSGNLAATLDFYRKNFMDLMDTTTLMFPPVDQTPHQEFSGLLPDQNNNFELENPDTAIPQLSAYTNSNSDYDFYRNYTNPVSGTSDILFRVTFRSEPGTWNEHGVITLPFEGSSADISDYNYLLIDFRCNSDRRIRIDLESSAYPDQDGPFYGWEINAGIDSTTVVLPMYKVAYPSWTSQEHVLDEVLANVSKIRISPQAEMDNEGQMVNDPDICEVHIDNIRLVKR